MSKNNQNAFYFFMVDWKKQEERKGKWFKNGLQDVANNPELRKAWDNCTPQQRAHYKGLEMNNKNKIKNEKKTSVGESLNEIEKQDKEIQKCLANMKENIYKTVDEAETNNSLVDLKFYVIHINHLYSRVIDHNRMEYYPAEIGIAEFSLKEGITNTYELIVQSEVVLGYTSVAREHSKQTHQISEGVGEKDFGVIYKDICRFIKPGMKNGKLPPLYTMYKGNENLLYSTSSCLQKFVDAGGDSATSFDLYSFEALFVNLHNIKKKSYKNYDFESFDDIIVKKLIDINIYDYKQSLACDYHKTLEGSNYCSRAIVQRWVAVLCENCCELYNIEVVPGHHVPLDNAPSNKLTDSFANMSLNKGFGRQLTRPSSTSTYKEKHASERTYADEQRRRAESKPLKIYYHGSERPPFPESADVLHVIEQPLGQKETQKSLEFSKPTEPKQLSWSKKLFDLPKPVEPLKSPRAQKSFELSTPVVFTNSQGSRTSQELSKPQTPPWMRPPRLDDIESLTNNNDNFPQMGRGCPRRKNEIRNKFNKTYAGSLK